jgi:hypothetical protein
MKSRSVFSALILWFFLFLLFIPVVNSQSNTGRVLGTVHDQSGGGIANATITILDVDRGLMRTTVTDSSGEYLVPNLAPGNYHVRAEAKGFKTSEREKVLLEVAKDVNLEFVLVPGSVTDVVTVTEEAPLLDTSSTTLGGTISNQTINDLPLNGRDFQNLVTLRPGVQRYPGGGFLSISSNGNRPEDNNFIVDGTDNNDPYYGTTVINAEGVQGTPATHMPIDAIQEFNAEENPPAEYGWKPGAIVNVGLKSGTNDYHGTVYDFERNNFFDARNWFNTKPGPQKALRLHEFGANIGAPIIKNKLFYFVAYEGVRDLVGNSEVLPTPVTSSLGGDPTNSIPDAIAAVQAAGLTPSALSLSLLKFYPTNAGSTPNLQVGFPNKNREDNGLVKMDYHFNDRQTLSGHYFIGDSLQTERDIPVLQPIWQSQAKTRAQVGGFSWVNSISDRLTNEARFGYNRFWQTILTVDAGVNPIVYGLNTGVTSPVNFGFPEIAVSGFNSLGGNHGWPLLTTPNQTYQWADIVSYTRGKHAWKFGGELRHGSTENVRDRYGKGRFKFQGGSANNLPGCAASSCFGLDSNGKAIPSTALEDFIAGAPSVGRLFQGNSQRHVSLSSIGLFAQDDWRVTPFLTINAGLRYDLSTVIKERDDLLGNFDPKLGLLQVGSQISDPYRGDHNNFGPRLGIVWDPFGKGKTIIRTGASIIYEIPHISTFIGQNGVDNATTAGLNVIPTGAGGINVPGGKIVAASNDFTTLNWSVAGPIFPATPPACTASSPCAILAVNRNIRTPYVVSWNLNIQQTITANSSFTAAYVGTKGIKLYSVYDINQVDPASPAEIACGHCEQAGRPFNSQFPYLSFINYLSNGYESKYHGLQLTFNQRLTHGLSFIAGYTWAHAIDQASLNRAIQPQNSLNPRAEWASSDIDIRQRFTLALTYAVPGIKSWGQMLEGWQLNSILTLQTGLPWGPIDGFYSTGGSDISKTAEFADRWNFTGKPSDFRYSTSGGLPYISPSSFTVDLNGDVTGVVSGAPAGAATCFAAAGSQAAANSLASLGCYAVRNSVLTPPAAGTFGTMGRNLFRGPGYRNWDLSVVKIWTFRERFALQLRGEFFNVLNHPNFTNPYGVGGQLGNVDPSVPAIFGFSSLTPDVAAANPVIGSGGPRAIQVGLKFKY